MVVAVADDAAATDFHVVHAFDQQDVGTRGGVRPRDEPRLAAYGYLAAARGELLRRAGRPAEARTALEEAALLTANDVERKLLADRLASLDV